MLVAIYYKKHFIYNVYDVFYLYIQFHIPASDRSLF